MFWEGFCEDVIFKLNGGTKFVWGVSLSKSWTCQNIQNKQNNGTLNFFCKFFFCENCLVNSFKPKASPMENSALWFWVLRSRKSRRKFFKRRVLLAQTGQKSLAWFRICQRRRMTRVHPLSSVGPARFLGGTYIISRRTGCFDFSAFLPYLDSVTQISLLQII